MISAGAEPGFSVGDIALRILNTKRTLATVPCSSPPSPNKEVAATSRSLLVYLDLNFWIGLAKVRVGHRDGARYQAAYQLLERLTSGGAVQAVLSAEHYAEMDARIPAVRQRNDVALTMAELTNYATLASRTQLLQAEFRRALAKALGLPQQASAGPHVVGHGAGYALGHPFRGELKGPPGSETWEPDEHIYKALDHLEAFVGGGWRFKRRHTITNRRALLVEALNEVTEFMLLRGPRPTEVDQLRTYGYRPEEAREMTERVAEREQRIMDRLQKSTDSRRRLEDIVGASTYVYDINPTILPAVLAEFGLPPQALLDLGKAGMTRVLADTPILDVEMALRRGNFKQGSYVWKVNDVYDIAALGSAVVYCDVVATDRSAAHRLTTARMGSLYACTIVSSAEKLTQTLQSIEAKAAST